MFQTAFCDLLRKCANVYILIKKLVFVHIFPKNLHGFLRIAPTNMLFFTKFLAFCQGRA